LAYQSPASSTFLSEQTSQQQPANSTFLSEQTSTSHHPPAKRTGSSSRRPNSSRAAAFTTASDLVERDSTLFQDFSNGLELGHSWRSVFVYYCSGDDLDLIIA
jgi:hypothetical protein